MIWHVLHHTGPDKCLAERRECQPSRHVHHITSATTSPPATTTRTCTPTSSTAATKSPTAAAATTTPAATPTTAIATAAATAAATSTTARTVAAAAALSRGGWGNWNLVGSDYSLDLNTKHVWYLNVPKLFWFLLIVHLNGLDWMVQVVKFDLLYHLKIQQFAVLYSDESVDHFYVRYFTDRMPIK